MENVRLGTSNLGDYKALGLLGGRKGAMAHSSWLFVGRDLPGGFTPFIGTEIKG